MNGDNAQDLAVVSGLGTPGGSRCCWAMATGPSRPGVRLAVGRFASAAAVDDFNGDGKLDVVVATPTSDGSVGVAVLLNNTPL